MLTNLSWLTGITRLRKTRQVVSLYTSMVLGLVIGIGASIINARYLGPEQYGDFKFLLNLFTFTITILTFGFFYSSGRLVAQRKHKEHRQDIMGAAVVIASVISIIMIMVLLFYSFFQNGIFNNELGHVIRIFLPLLLIYPFQLCCEQLLQGDNRIYLLSAFRLGPKLLYLITAVLFNYFIPLSLVSALFIHLVSIILLLFFVLFRLQPKMSLVKTYIKVIKEENKIFGFPVFIGALFGLASAQIGGFTISYFIDNKNVGFFLLAITASMPLAMIPNTIGITFFKDFSNMPKIPGKVIMASIILSLLSLAMFLLFIKPIVIFLYSEEFAPVIPLSYSIAIGSTLHGMGDFINRFLSAKGQGKLLRNSNIIIGIVNLSGYFILVYFIGVQGAAITKFVAGSAYLTSMIFFYLTYIKSHGNHSK